MAVTVLVVDDEPDVQILIKQKFRRQIRSREYRFLFALNGLEALALLRENRDVDVLVTDLNMPEMDGLSLLNALDDIPELLLKAIVVTAYGDMGNIRAAMNRGAVDFLTKPIDFADLDLTIRKALRYVEDLKARQRIEQEKSRVEAENRAKSLFLASMSHEIRNPMNAILGMCELLGDTRLDDEQRAYVRTLSAAGEVLLELLDDLLDLSKIERGVVEIERADYRLRDALEQVVMLGRARAQAKGLSFHARLDDQLPGRARGDARRLKQILLNLLFNAIKFTADGEVSLGARRQGDALIFEVADTGIGIAADRQARIFESFTQADPSIQLDYGGSGLGLAISHKLARAMGGDLTVDSALGQGSRFRVTLPFAPAAGPEAEAPEPADDAGPEGLHILLAEDSEHNRLLIERFLTRAGHRLDLAVNGQEAIDLITTNSYALVLMDMQMPVMDGYTATRCIRAWERDQPEGQAPLPIIALTAYAHAGEREKCLEAGCSEHVPKPIKKATLFDTIARHARQP